MMLPFVRRCYIGTVSPHVLQRYIITSAVCGFDYQLYFTVAFMKHAQSWIQKTSRCDDFRDAFSLRLEAELQSFDLTLHTRYIRDLEVKYRPQIVAIVANYT